MKRTGILTFHRAINYGAVLQAVALYTKCNELNPCNVEIIDYYCSAIEDQYAPNIQLKDICSVKSALITILQHHSKKNRYVKFGDFIERNTHLSQRVIDVKQINNLGYQTMITGSDQVWNSQLANFDQMYFLQPFNCSVDKYSYAASLGMLTIPKDQREEYKDRLSGFPIISVRESSAAKLLQEIVSAPIRVDIDPTLLLRADEWEPFISNNARSEPYILLYTVERPIRLIQKVRKFAKEVGLPVVYINNGPGMMLSNFDFKFVTDAGPDEFLALFKNAQYVFTNSFHGTVFSIVFHKKFIVELNNGRVFNSRSNDLLTSLGIGMCEMKDDFDVFDFLYKQKMDWEQIDKRLECLRSDSASYLNEIMNS